MGSLEHDKIIEEDAETIRKLIAETGHTQMDDLNEFLREIADNDKVGIRRKLVAIKRYIANIENGCINKQR